MLLWCALVVGCATTDIPNVRVYREIPFSDAPEAVYVETISGNQAILGPEEYEKVRPYMLMIDPEGWKAIRASWYKACRMAGERCNVTVDSIDEVIKKLDALAGRLIKF